MPGPHRRSLGTKAVDLVPQRLSKNPTPSKSYHRPSSSAASGETRMSRSRLPKPFAAAGEKPTVRVRSSGNRTPASSLRGAAAAAMPVQRRSQSAYFTPLPSNPRNRMSSVDTSSSKQEANRASAVGTKSRLMNDKAFQREVEREIVCFCQSNDYPDPSFSQSSFPLSSTHFKTLFVFLVRFVNPDCPDLGQKFEEKIPESLKGLGYAAHVSKQTFQTLGTLHSWPAVLSSLYFVYGLAKVQRSNHNSLRALVFPNEDEAGFANDAEPSKDQMFFDCLADSYNVFNANRNSYDDVDAEYESRLVEDCGVDEHRMASMMQVRERLEAEIAEGAAREEARAATHKELKGHRDVLVEDGEKLEDFRSKLANKIRLCSQEAAAQDEKAKASGERLDLLAEEVARLAEECKRKDVNPDACSSVAMAIDGLRDQVAARREKVRASDEGKLQLEMEVSKTANGVETLSTSLNKFLIEIGVFGDGDGELVLGTHTSPASARRFLDGLASDRHHKGREVASGLQLAEREIEAEEGGCEALEAERERLAAALFGERDKSRRSGGEAEAKLARLEVEREELKEALVREHQQARGDLGELEGRVAELRAALEAQQKEREGSIVHGDRLVQMTIQVLRLKREEQLAIGSKVVEEHKRLCAEEVEEIKKRIEFLKSFFDDIPNLPPRVHDLF